MLPNVTEIVLVALIVMVVFGAGKLGRVIGSLGKVPSKFKEGMSEDRAIDITPDHARERAPSARKPGKFDLPVEDATVEASRSE